MDGICIAKTRKTLAVKAKGVYREESKLSSGKTLQSLPTIPANKFRHCDEGALPDEAISSRKQEDFFGKTALAMTIKREVIFT